jgi:hypothetical protein
MRFVFILFGILFLNGIVLAQAKLNDVSFNFGFHQIQSSGRLGYIMSDEGAKVLEQKATTFFDFNVLVSRKFQTNKTDNKHFRKVKLNYGFGLNQKGIKQKISSNTGAGDWYEHQYTIRRNYLSLYFGCAYYFFEQKNFRSGIELLLNPDLDIRKIVMNDSYFSPSPLSLSLRMIVPFEYTNNKQLAFRFSPYFQYSLTNYYSSLKTPESYTFRPFGLGLNFGCVF